MPNTREKLIELLAEFCQYKEKRCVGCDPGKHYHPECKSEQFGKIADHLIANGVTIQRWIPVSERLPKDNERVLVYHDDGVMRFGINKDGFADVVSSLYLRNNHRTCFSKVTHWMPLPQPPKEGE